MQPLKESYARFDLGWPIRVHLGQVHAEERPVGFEHLHGQTALTDEVPLPDFDHTAELCDTVPLDTVLDREEL